MFVQVWALDAQATGLGLIRDLASTLRANVFPRVKNAQVAFSLLHALLRGSHHSSSRHQDTFVSLAPA